MPKKMSPEVKARAVRMVREHQKDYPSVTAAALAVARQFGLGRETVRRWMVQAGVDGGARPGLSSEDHAEIKRLKAENRRLLREDVEILARQRLSSPQCHREACPAGVRSFLRCSCSACTGGWLVPDVRPRSGVLMLAGVA